ncbi:MAG: hypothetical protein R3E64_17310 [Halioglobus sp.]
MKIATGILTLFKASTALLATLVGLLFSANEDQEDRPLAHGSDLIGEHNFRTGSMDSGSDPDGWYEEDL